MRNVVGQTPRGNDFFPRNAIINKIYRRLESGENLFLAAPRRVGKTSIMRAMEDAPRDNFQFVYIITESINNVEDYYHKLLTATLGSEALSKLAQKREGIKNLVRDIAGNISIKLPWIELQVNKQDERETYQSAFEKLLTKLDTGEDAIVIMIDEFPQTVENIRETHGNQVAETFLRLNRAQRQTTNSKIRFILTGSIGLPAVVKKLTSDSVINDLNVVEIPPLLVVEATDMCEKLLREYHVDFDESVVPYLLERISWLIPFHIQLGVQELIDLFENNNQRLNKNDVDKAFQQMLNLRNDIYFNHYYTRLHEAFPKDQCDVALHLLARLGENESLTVEEVRTIANNLSPRDLEGLLESLEYDGYIFFDAPQKSYRFQSALLREWWNKKTPGQL
jgi:hypothetical protein